MRAGTRRLLWWQLAALLVLVTTATVTVHHAYTDLHGRPERLRERTAPAVLDATATRSALLRTHRAAQVSLTDGVTAPTETDEHYRVLLAGANRNLSELAQEQVAGEKGRRILRTVQALLDVYTDSVDMALDRSVNPRLGRAWFSGSAEPILKRDGTGILSRLDELQAEQYRVLEEQSSFTGRRWLPWGVAGAAVLALLAALVLTQLWLFRRFPERLSSTLLAATVLVAVGSPVLVGQAEQTQHAMDAARRELVVAIDAQKGERIWMPERTTASLERVDDRLAATGGEADAAVTIPVLAGVVGALVGSGLGRRLRRYRYAS